MGLGALIASGGDIQFALVSGLTGGAAGYIGASSTFGVPGEITASRIAAHGFTGGLSAKIQGGKFASGFISSAFVKAVSRPIHDAIGSKTIGQRIQGAIAAGVIGGTASRMGGGNFANGARATAFQYLFNEASKMDVWNRKVLKDTIILEEPVGEPYQGIYEKSDWRIYNGSQVHASDALPHKRILAVIKALSTQYDELREITTGDLQNYESYRYDTVYDLVNGERVNESILYETRSYIGSRTGYLNTNVSTKTENRSCYVLAGGC